MDLTCPSLVIDKIVVTNFKSFLGKNEIILGHSPEKFVNIIEGPCGSGKTTIVDAVRWACIHGDQETSTQDLSLINYQLLKSLKNHQKVEVSVQVFLTEENSDSKLKIERTCEYSFFNEDLSLVSDVRAVKELKNSRWIDVDYEIPGGSYLLSFWNGDQNPINLIESIVPSLSKISNLSNERIKEIVSSAVLQGIKKIYPFFKITVDFDDNEILHVNYRNRNFLSTMPSTGLTVLWLSLMAAVRESTNCHLPLILDSAFSRLDMRHRTIFINYFMDTIRGGQLICFGSEREFEPVMDNLKPITNRHYHLGN